MGRRELARDSAAVPTQKRGRETFVLRRPQLQSRGQPRTDGVKEGRKREGVKEEGILLRKRRGKGEIRSVLKRPLRSCSFRSLLRSIHPVSTIIQDGSHHPRRPLNYVAVNDDGGAAARAPTTPTRDIFQSVVSTSLYRMNYRPCIGLKKIRLHSEGGIWLQINYVFTYA